MRFPPSKSVRPSRRESPLMTAAFFAAYLAYVFSLLTTPTAAQRPKILCLHGGGSNAAEMRGQVADLRRAMPQFQFIFANGGYRSGGSYLWIRDPPGGKGQPTTSRFWAERSIRRLNALRRRHGPFFGILGYSQGAAFVPVYLSRVPTGTFGVAIAFCGYLTTTHRGLLQVVQQRSPFGDIPAVMWMGRQDYVITNSLSMGMSRKFTRPMVIRKGGAGHIVPYGNDPTIRRIANFVLRTFEAAMSNRYLMEA